MKNEKLLISKMKREHSWQSYGHNRIITEHCEQLYTNKSNNLDLMDKLLEKQDRSSKKQKENLNKYIISK